MWKRFHASILVILVLCHIHNASSRNITEDIRSQVIFEDLVTANQLRMVDPSYIHLAIIIANVKVEGLVQGILTVFRKLLHSLIYHSKETSLHIILITDTESRDSVHRVVMQTIGQYLSESVIRLVHNRKQQLQALIFPQLFVEFVDLKSIIEPNRESIDVMKKIYCANRKEPKLVKLTDSMVVSISAKYSQDLFYIGPHYATAFSQLNRLMVFDADLEMREDLSVLYSMFEDMQGEEIIGVALDQTGFYKPASEGLRKAGLLSLDDPAMYRGINTGVVLYNLEKMRLSGTYQEQLKKENYVELTMFNWNIPTHEVGDQDWFNVLMWKYPKLFKILPCEYNVQQTPHPFDKYECTAEPRIMHIHAKIHESG